jgi:hypothetical protein
LVHFAERFQMICYSKIVKIRYPISRMQRVISLFLLAFELQELLNELLSPFSQSVHKEQLLLGYNRGPPNMTADGRFLQILRANKTRNCSIWRLSVCSVRRYCSECHSTATQLLYTYNKSTQIEPAARRQAFWVCELWSRTVEKHSLLHVKCKWKGKWTVCLHCWQVLKCLFRRTTTATRTCCLRGIYSRSYHSTCNYTHYAARACMSFLCDTKGIG